MHTKETHGNSGLTPLFQPESEVPDTDTLIDFTPAMVSSSVEDTVVHDMGDGTVIVEFDDEAQEYDDLDDDDHDANLAKSLDQRVLDELAQKIIEEVEIDKAGREPWNQLYKTGIETLGITDEKASREIFDGASKINYPMLSTAVINFQARAISEIYPAGGPVKTRILGEETLDVRAQAKRVKDYMNYQITDLDEAFFDELDQLLFFLPISGSAFKKVYWDPYTNVAVSKFVRPDQLIVPYTATSLATAERYTHQILMQRNEMKKLQTNGFYLDIQLVTPSMEKGGEYNSVDAVNDKADNKTPAYDDDDYRHTLYESHRYCDLKGYEHKDDSGKPTGVQLPYIVTVDLDTRKVLSIRRNWEQGDAEYKKRVWFIHYKYLPGTGFYGFGLVHLIGGLQKAATGASRIMLDSSALASMQGGFRSKNVNAKAGDTILTPGEWKDINMTAEELSKAFYTPPFKEPSPALAQFLEFVVDAGQRLTSTTEAMVGDAKNTGPVGTTLALIEQGSKVYSGIHKRLHQAAGREYKLRAKLNAENLEHDQAYPYTIEGASQFIKGSDFDDRIDVIPASDPNVFSSTQRIAKAQSIKQLSDASPDLYNRYEVERIMLQALEVPNIDKVLPDPEKIERLDPINENAAMMSRKPVKVYPDQDHASHIAVHMAFLEHPNFGGDPSIREMLMEAMIAHIAQHKGYEFRDMMAKAGALVMPIDIGNMDQKTEEVTPEEDYLISMGAAQAIGNFMQMSGSPVTNPAAPEDQQPPVDPIAQQKAQLEIQAGEQNLKLAQERAMAEQDNQRQMADLKQQEIDNAAALRRDQLNKDHDLAMEKIRREYDFKREESERNRQMEYNLRLADMLIGSAQDNEQAQGSQEGEDNDEAPDIENTLQTPDQSMREVADAIRQVAESLKDQQETLLNRGPQTVTITKDKSGKSFTGRLVRG